MKENKDFLTKQIITYIGNKRLLLKFIEEEVKEILKSLNKDKAIIADVFSGSGVVARLLKQYSQKLFVNDLETYSCIINSCYLSNKSDFNRKEYLDCKVELDNALLNLKRDGLIYSNYAPKNDERIEKGERVFYTTQNAKIIDTTRMFIETIPDKMQKYFLAPLLYSASVHVNTGGVFKGFYKNKNTGLGQFGGTAQNALSRITGKIETLEPVLSNFECVVKIFNDDSNKVVSELKDADENIDIAYIDPPYNIHPYGSNYFMLNVIAKNKIQAPVSKVSGIPNDWNRSLYNKAMHAKNALENLIENCNSKYIILSYNSEGLIKFDELSAMLKNFGKLKIKKLPYNAYRASRNLNKRSLYVEEFLFILEKR